MIPKRYLKTAEKTIATFDYFDLAQQRGIKLFYAGDAINKVLAGYKFYSTIGVSGATDTTLDLDFDITLAKPLNVEGISIIQIPVLLLNNGGAGAAISCTVTARVRHWDGSTETTLVSGSVTCASHTGEDVPAGGYRNRMASIEVSIPRKRFKSGETLRLTVEVSDPGENKFISVGHDPMGRTTIPESVTASQFAGSWTETSMLTFPLPIIISL